MHTASQPSVMHASPIRPDRVSVHLDSPQLAPSPDQLAHSLANTLSLSSASVSASASLTHADSLSTSAHQHHSLQLQSIDSRMFASELGEDGEDWDGVQSIGEPGVDYTVEVHEHTTVPMSDSFLQLLCAPDQTGTYLQSPLPAAASVSTLSVGESACERGAEVAYVSPQSAVSVCEPQTSMLCEADLSDVDSYMVGESILDDGMFSVSASAVRCVSVSECVVFVCGVWLGVYSVNMSVDVCRSK
jgi:hypothetical protein